MATSSACAFAYFGRHARQLERKLLERDIADLKRTAGGIEQVCREHGVELHILELDPSQRKRGLVELAVVAVFDELLGTQYTLERGQIGLVRVLEPEIQRSVVFRGIDDLHVGRFVRPRAETDPDDLRADRLAIRCVALQRKLPCPLQRAQKLFEFLGGADPAALAERRALQRWDPTFGPADFGQPLEHSLELKPHEQVAQGIVVRLPGLVLIDIEIDGQIGDDCRQPLAGFGQYPVLFEGLSDLTLG